MKLNLKLNQHKYAAATNIEQYTLISLVQGSVVCMRTKVTANLSFVCCLDHFLRNKSLLVH